jgi:hypothetical protein
MNPIKVSQIFSLQLEIFEPQILQPFCKTLRRSDALKLRELSMTNASPTF